MMPFTQQIHCKIKYSYSITTKRHGLRANQRISNPHSARVVRQMDALSSIVVSYIFVVVHGYVGVAVVERIPVLKDRV